LDTALPRYNAGTGESLSAAEIRAVPGASSKPARTVASTQSLAARLQALRPRDCRSRRGAVVSRARTRPLSRFVPSDNLITVYRALSGFRIVTDQHCKDLFCNGRRAALSSREMRTHDDTPGPRPKRARDRRPAFVGRVVAGCTFGTRSGSVAERVALCRSDDKRSSRRRPRGASSTRSVVVLSISDGGVGEEFCVPEVWERGEHRLPADYLELRGFLAARVLWHGSTRTSTRPVPGASSS
jgi:hypothetical protein